MSETPTQFLLAVFGKCGKFFVRGVITPQEFTNRVLDEFASTKQVYPEIVPDLWILVPDPIRSMFVATIHDAVQPDFRYQAFYINGVPSRTEDEMRREADLNTANVKAWAREFVKFWKSTAL